MEIGFGQLTPIEIILLWTAAGGAGALVLLWLRRSRRRRSSAVPVVDWEARAQAAERRAMEAETVVKTGLIPHLARLLRAKLVTGLLHQRRQLVEGQETGAQRAEALEARLANAQEGLKQKLRDYETKVKTLEAQAGARPIEDPTPGPRPALNPSPRKNPLVTRPVRPPPAPVRFGELVARKEEAKTPGAFRGHRKGGEIQRDKPVDPAS